MNEVKITPNGIKQAIDDLLNENELLQEKNKRLNTDKEQLTSLVNSCQEKIRKLKTQLQQEKNIKKEVREYIVTHKLYCFKYDNEELFEIVTDKKAKDKLLEILERENNNARNI